MPPLGAVVMCNAVSPKCHGGKATVLQPTGSSRVASTMHYGVHNFEGNGIGGGPRPHHHDVQEMAAPPGGGMVFRHGDPDRGPYTTRAVLFGP